MKLPTLAENLVRWTVSIKLAKYGMYILIWYVYFCICGGEYNNHTLWQILVRHCAVRCSLQKFGVSNRHWTLINYCTIIAYLGPIHVWFMSMAMVYLCFVRQIHFIIVNIASRLNYHYLICSFCFIFFVCMLDTVCCSWWRNKILL